MIQPNITVWLAQNPKCGRTVVGVSVTPSLIGPAAVSELTDLLRSAWLQAHEESYKRGYGPRWYGWLAKFLLIFHGRRRFQLNPDIDA